MYVEKQVVTKGCRDSQGPEETSRESRYFRGLGVPELLSRAAKLAHHQDIANFFKAPPCLKSRAEGDVGNRRGLLFHEECAAKVMEVKGELVCSHHKDSLYPLLEMLAKWRDSERHDQGKTLMRELDEQLLITHISPRGSYKSIYNAISRINQEDRVYNNVCKVNFPGLSFTTKKEKFYVAEDGEHRRIPALSEGIKIKIFTPAEEIILTTACNFAYVFSYNGIDNLACGVIEHTGGDNLKKALDLLAILFSICCVKMKGNSPKILGDKLSQIATFEWIFQQAAPFTRGTPVIAKVIVAAMLELHGFSPIHRQNHNHNEMNCFLSFSGNLDEYLTTWHLYTPYVKNDTPLRSLCGDELIATGREETGSKKYQGSSRTIISREMSERTPLLQSIPHAEEDQLAAYQQTSIGGANRRSSFYHRFMSVPSHLLSKRQKAGLGREGQIGPIIERLIETTGLATEESRRRGKCPCCSLM